MNLFCIALPDGGKGAIFHPLTKTWDFFAVPKEESFIDVLASRISPSEITHITVINGPGPFLLLRSLAVMANTWKRFSPIPIRISAIPTEVFLQNMFPSAEILVMSAGKRNVLFARHEENGMQKKKLEEVLPLLSSALWGGIFMEGVEEDFSPEILQKRVLPVSAEEYWGKCEKMAEHFCVEEILVQYAKGDEWEKFEKD